MRVLIADDDAQVGELIVELLSGEGYEVSLVSNPHEARRGAHEEAWDVFLVDSFSPGGQKIDVASVEFLRSLAERAPVIVMSAHTWAKTAQPSDLGVAAVLPKPFDIEELLGAVRSIAG